MCLPNESISTLVPCDRCGSMIEAESAQRVGEAFLCISGDCTPEGQRKPYDSEDEDLMEFHGEEEE